MTLSFVNSELETEALRMIELQDWLTSFTVSNLSSISEDIIGAVFFDSLDDYRVFANAVLIDISHHGH
jgi:hypothetical protein